MRITYFCKTDTAEVEFAKGEVAETKELNGTVRLGIGPSGDLVSMTIGQARQHASLPSLSYHEKGERSGERPEQPKARTRGLPENAGKPWSDEENRQVVESYDAGKTLKEIAGDHRRTEFAIQSRLIKLGRIQA